MLTKEEKAYAIQFAMDLEREKFCHYAIKGFFMTFTKAERKRIFDFWRTCCPLTQKAYAACCYYIDNQERNNVFLMTKKEMAIGAFGVVVGYITLALFCIALGGFNG